METLKVEQCDRDALEDIDDALGFLMDNEREIVLQAFAKHRTAERERNAGICDEMEQDQNGRAYDKRQAGRDDTHNCAKAAVAGQLAQAIRAASDD